MARKGFSLIELSIVILIVGLLLLGITSATKLVKQAEMRKLIAEVDEIKQAMQTFFGAYNELPGDMENATIFFTGTGNGDGDGNIEVIADSAGAGASEVGRVFEHLSKAEIYEGEFTPGNRLASEIIPTTPEMAPDSIRNSKIIVTSYTERGGWPMNGPRNNIGGNSVNVIRLGRHVNNISHTNTFLGIGIFTIEEVILLDRKFDDGLARSGVFTGHNEFLDTDSESEEQCLTFSSGTTHNPALDRGGADYNPATTFMCNVSFDTDF